MALLPPPKHRHSLLAENDPIYQGTCPSHNSSTRFSPELNSTDEFTNTTRCGTQGRVYVRSNQSHFSKNLLTKRGGAITRPLCPSPWKTAVLKTDAGRPEQKVANQLYPEIQIQNNNLDDLSEWPFRSGGSSRQLQKGIEKSSREESLLQLEQEQAHKFIEELKVVMEQKKVEYEQQLAEENGRKVQDFERKVN